MGKVRTSHVWITYEMIFAYISVQRDTYILPVCAISQRATAPGQVGLLLC